MKKMVLVIHGYDYDDKTRYVVGVASTVELAGKLIDQYYGSYELQEFKDIRDSNLEYSKTIKVSDGQGKTYDVAVTLEWFAIDEA